MTLQRVPIPPGPDGLAALLPALQDALVATSEPIAPVPTVSATISTEYVTKLLNAIALDEPTHELTAVVLTTSGSTGNPRAVEFSTENFAAIGDSVAINHSWVAALPLTSVGGFNVAARAVLSGGQIVAVDSLGGATPFTPKGFAAAVNALDDLIATSLVPAQLSRLLHDDDGVAALQRCSTILVGGGATDPELVRRAAWNKIRVTLTYGMTETTGGCVFNGVPVGDTEVTIESDRIRLTGSSIALKYRDTYREFGGTFLTNDIGTFIDGMLHVTGRIDDVVMINGVNVSPVAVEHLLRSIPSVHDAAVIVVNDALCAFVATDAPFTPDAARQLVATELGKVAVPTTITQVDALPYLPNGKIDRMTLAQDA